MRIVWGGHVIKDYMPGEDRPITYYIFGEPYEPRHRRDDWTETDERLAMWDEDENGHVMFPQGGKHMREGY